MHRALAGNLLLGAIHTLSLMSYGSVTSFAPLIILHSYKPKAYFMYLCASTRVICSMWTLLCVPAWSSERVRVK